MIRFAWIQLRRRASRSVALLLGLLVATSGFTVLTGSVASSRLSVTETVEANSRGVYDILVRPPGSRSPTEATEGLVRGNYLSDGFAGGITLDTVDRIAAMDGIEVAAPIGMGGYLPHTRTSYVDVTAHVDTGAGNQIIRLRNTWRTDRGLSEVADPGTSYVYLTTNPIAWPKLDHDSLTTSYPAARGAELDGSPCDVGDTHANPPFEEISPGRWEPVCVLNQIGGTPSAYDADERGSLLVIQRTPAGFVTFDGETHVEAELRIGVKWSVPALLAAVDPVAEAALTGLDTALSTGRPLTPGETVYREPGNDIVFVPMLASTSLGVDQRVGTEISTGRLPLPGMTLDESAERLAALDAESAETVAGAIDAAVLAGDLFDISAGVIYLPAPLVSTVDGDGVLRPAEAPDSAGGSWYSPPFVVHDDSSMLLTDTAFHEVSLRPGAAALGISQADVVGTFDPAALTAVPGLAAGSNSYETQRLTPADDTSTALLNGQPLLPTGNPAGYLTAPPQLLTTFETLTALTPGKEYQWKAPVSAVRIRVSGIDGLDESSRERIRLVAEGIQRETGLDVDITIGASPTGRPVLLPAGELGRPELLLEEQWTKKGVAVALIEAVDRKSVVLFGLILVVCVLFLGNAVTASVRTRRHELAVLAAVGWPGRRLMALVLAEVGAVGLAAGVLGAGVSVPATRWLSVGVPVGQALLAVPVAVVLALLAGAVPAWRVRRLDPMAALRPPVSDRAVTAGRGLLGLALANLRRLPGRSLLGVLALAVGTGAMAVLAAAMWGFHGTAHGSLLGDHVSVQVRGVDLAAAALTMMLGALSIADLVYLNIRERDAELATLRAIGWGPGHLFRLIAGEGVALGVTGAIVGTATGLGAVSALMGAPDSRVWAAAGVVGGAAVVLTAAMSVVAALTVRGRPLTELLTRDG
ncbi:ABC transporter permease [Phytomonospora sp. NPDC050363]|uniref:ABC transporter permease n=1 Tax=Phytomonospora sp. NPDC050363 TaxID=3155642 RepID=UPI0033C52F59